MLERIAWGSHQTPQLYNQGGGIQAQRTHYTKCVIGKRGKIHNQNNAKKSNLLVQGKREGGPAQTTSIQLRLPANGNTAGHLNVINKHSRVTITSTQRKRCSTIHENLQQKNKDNSRQTTALNYNSNVNYERVPSARLYLWRDKFGNGYTYRPKLSHRNDVGHPGLPGTDASIRNE